MKLPLDHYETSLAIYPLYADDTYTVELGDL